MTNERDVMNDIIDRLHGQYGCVIGALDNTDNTIDVRTIDDDVIMISISVRTCDMSDCKRATEHDTQRETTFATVADVSRYVTQYHACYIGNGMCVPFNRDVLRGWLRELALTNDEINVFCDDHGIPHVV